MGEQSAIHGLRFPSVEIRSRSEFQGFLDEKQYELDRRYQYEQSLGSKHLEIKQSGTCGACLRPTIFASSTANGELLPDGRIVPNWREESKCGCALRLNSLQRSLLHFAQSKLGLSSTSNVGLLGESGPVVAALYTSGIDVVCQPRLITTKGGQQAAGLSPEAGVWDIVMSLDYINRVVDMDGLFREASRVLRRTGYFVFSTPFYVYRDNSSLQPGFSPQSGILEHGYAVHEIAWDILPRLCEASFSDAWVEIFWSEEFGYLGPFNSIIVASKS